MIVVESLVKAYGDRRALDGLDLQAVEGEVLGLLGPNGAGKTTIINVLATLTRPDTGRASVCGHDVVTAPERVREVSALTGQYAAVDAELTGRENLVLFARLRGLTKGAARARADQLLEQFGLADAAGGRARTYSGGIRRRLDLAASLVVEPMVLFLDEPTTGLDPRARADLWDVVRQLRSRGITIVLTTQYLEEADVLADRIVVVDQGRVIAEGSSGELKARVGGAVCHVELADAAQHKAAEAALAGRLDVTVDEQSGRLSFPAPRGARDLAEAVRRLEDARVQTTDLTLRRPSLDEVFLALTGSQPGAGGPAP